MMYQVVVLSPNFMKQVFLELGAKLHELQRVVFMELFFFTLREERFFFKFPVQYARYKYFSFYWRVLSQEIESNRTDSQISAIELWQTFNSFCDNFAYVFNEKIVKNFKRIDPQNL